MPGAGRTGVANRHVVVGIGGFEPIEDTIARGARRIPSSLTFWRVQVGVLAVR